MLLSTAIQVRPGNSAPVYPNLKPHLGLYSVRTRAHPKKSTFVQIYYISRPSNTNMLRFSADIIKKNLIFQKFIKKCNFHFLWLEIVKHVEQVQNSVFILLYNGAILGHQLFEIDLLSTFYAWNHSFFAVESSWHLKIYISAQKPENVPGSKCPVFDQCEAHKN